MFSFGPATAAASDSSGLPALPVATASTSHFPSNNVGQEVGAASYAANSGSGEQASDTSLLTTSQLDSVAPPLSNTNVPDTVQGVINPLTENASVYDAVQDANTANSSTSGNPAHRSSGKASH
jgi:hypothetical protein